MDSNKRMKINLNEYPDLTDEWFSYNKSSIIIQRIWKGKRVRSKINNIYKHLPIDIQKKICFYIRENYLIKKHHHKVIEKIIYNKTTFQYQDVFIIPKYTLHIADYLANKIITLLDLYIKYFKILNRKQDNLLLLQYFIHLHGHYFSIKYYSIYTMKLDIFKKLITNKFLIKY